MTAARRVAVVVLERVAEQGAYASRALDAELARAKLHERDAALATEIVYGALRVLPELDAQLATYLTRDPASMDSILRAALRAGAYQLRHLSRAPAHAVVSESVSIVRDARGPKLAGVANAVLRKLAQAQPTLREPARAIALPPWAAGALQRALGAERCTAWLKSAGQPPLALRVAARHDRSVLMQTLREARTGAVVREGRVSPLALLLDRAGDPRTLPGYAEGHFSVQEEGAQLIALALGAQPGEAVADLCAGHGGKTTFLCEAVGPTGSVVAVDLDDRKLERIAAELTRLGLPASTVQCRAIDLTVGDGDLGPRFERVLVDAPCTGLGTIRRRPELLLRLTESDPARMAVLQLGILRQAARVVRPGGTLLYAVCSPTLEEGPGVAAQLEAELPSLTRLREPLLAQVPIDADGVMRLGPWLAGEASDSPDVYQIIAWRKS